MLPEGRESRYLQIEKCSSVCPLAFPVVLCESPRQALQSLSFLCVNGPSAKGTGGSRCAFCCVAPLPQHNQPQQRPWLSASWDVPERAGAKALDALQGKGVPVFGSTTRLSPPHQIIHHGAEDHCVWKTFVLQGNYLTIPVFNTRG